MLVYNQTSIKLAKLPMEEEMGHRISEAEFKQHAETAIDELERAFSEIAEKREIDVEVEGGVLTVSFEEDEPGKFIVSPNSSVCQLWVSARLASYKFDWSSEANQFALASTGESIKDVLTRLMREQLGDNTLSLT
jgi:iron-sulfur cluster assembly protein CyaY